MRKILSFLIGRHSVAVLIVVLGILDILLIASFIQHKILDFLKKNGLFEIVVLTTLVEILLLLSHRLWHLTPLAFGSEAEVQEKVRSLLKEDATIKSIKFLSAGLSSRTPFIQELLAPPGSLSLEVIACFGEESPNPDDWDREKLGPGNFEKLTKRIRPDEGSRLKIYRSFNTPSFRCILLSDSRGPRYGFVGWYTYRKRNSQIIGRRNIQIFADRKTELGVDLLHFAEKMLQQYSSEKESEILFPLKKKNEH